MQDAYVGDIGDYGKYGLLRQLARQGLALAVNWYQVIPRQPGKQDDGKFISYLSSPEIYRPYDPHLFDTLNQMVTVEQNRSIRRIEAAQLLDALFHSEPLRGSRGQWHQRALENTGGADLVFLDPDNGLETERMRQTGRATEKHVRRDELKDYYSRGQSLLLYQHLPQRMRKEDCVRSLMDYQSACLHADHLRILEFPRYTTRFYAFFLHEAHRSAAEAAFQTMAQHWQGMCKAWELPL